MHGSELFNKISVAGSMPPLMFVRIDASSPSDMIAQLAAKDAVHASGTETVERLCTHRLGGPRHNRDCFAIVDDNFKLQSAIYVHKDYGVMDNERSLNGNARSIVQQEVKEANGVPSSVIFYSICRLGTERGVGEKLIGHVHAYFTREYPHAVLSTLSPLRQPEGKYGINDYISERSGSAFSALDETAQRRIVLEFLLTRKEGVRDFHLSNGASIGDIKLNADTTGEHRVMVNYIYPRGKDTLASHKQLFAAGDTLSLTSHLLLSETGLSLENVPCAKAHPAAPSPA